MPASLWQLSNRCLFCSRVWLMSNTGSCDGEAIPHSAETSSAPSNGSMIPVMKARHCWQVNLQLTKPRLSKVALVDRRNSSCAPHFGHFTRRFCKSTFPASAAIAQSPPARCLWHPIRKGRSGLIKDVVNLTNAPGTNKTPQRSASTGAPGLEG